MNGFRQVLNCRQILDISKFSNTYSYNIYRHVRRSRLKKYTEEHDKLDRMLYNYVQQEHMDKLKKSEFYTESSDSKTPVTSKTHIVKEEIITDLDDFLQVKKISTPSDDIVSTYVKNVTEENQHEWLAKKVTPFYTMSYENQLKKKYNQNYEILREFGRELQKQGGKIPTASKDMPCVLDYTIASPVTEAYRNKDEFSIRSGVDGNPKTVGFFLESPNKNSECLCLPADNLIIIKESHKLVAKEFENYIRQSPLPACHNFADGGHWRNIIVRSNAEGDLMAIVIFSPQQLSKESIDEEMQKIKEYFYAKKDSLNIKSFYFQACPHVKCTHAEAPFHLLFGEPYLFESLNGIKFRISPEAFFQINTAAASLLYKLIVKTCKAQKTTTILDLCCGIGPISLAFAPHVKKCIGIDTSAEAIEDAKYNAKMNGIKNVEFQVGRSEYMLRNILEDIYAEELIAIVNPARSALGNRAIRTLRECKYLKKVLFVSCKPRAAIPNFVELCRPCRPQKEEVPRGAQFHPIRAVPVDLFPHTNHSELIIVFQRL